MKTLRVTARIEDDLCLATRFGSANEFVTEPFIPGSAVWGALAARTGIRPGEEPDDAFRRVFYSDEVRFLNLYPATPLKCRALPVPRSAREARSAPGFTNLNKVLFAAAADHYLLPSGVTDWLLDGPHDDSDDDRRRIDGFYGELFAQQGGGREAPRAMVAPQVVFNGHTDRSTPAGVARSGQLFQRHDLARGEEFVGAIVATTDEGGLDLVSVLQKADGLNSTVPLGRQPGHAQLSLEERPLEWADTPGEFDDPQLVSITLLSHAVVVDDWLRALPALSVAEIAAVLGVATVQPIRHFSSLISLYGWNGAHRRPREVETALAMGSAFLLRVTWPEHCQPADRIARLVALQSRGVGLRRAEGFGEVRVNDPFHQILGARP